jgi:hypothetical protein
MATKKLAATLASALIVGGMAGGVLLAAGPASATGAVIGDEGDYNPDNFRDELRYAGIYHEDVSNASELGPRICRQRAQGFSSSWLEDDLISNDYAVEQAVAIVRGAEWHFCPRYGKD